MNIKPIITDTEYQTALKEVENLMMSKSGTPEGEKLDAIATLIEAYETKHFPLDFPTPVETNK